MGKASKRQRGIGKDPPRPDDFDRFRRWVANQPREWSVAIASRAALRALPLIRDAKPLPLVALSVFRASAIAFLAARYSLHSTPIISAADAAANAADGARYVIDGFESAAQASYAAANAAYATAFAYAAASAAAASNAAISAAVVPIKSVMVEAIRDDAQQLHNGAIAPEELAASALWAPSPPRMDGIWEGLKPQLYALGDHWSVWIGWYEDVIHGVPRSRAEEAAFTDLAGELPWVNSAKAVNMEIARRLAEIGRPKSVSILPSQSPAPVRVEERDGRVSKIADRDSALIASERDFAAWRDLVVDHVAELSRNDFRAGTNHGYLRERLTALGSILPGEIPEVKERQFRIGYEIERFDGLISAYHSGGNDMPSLNAAQLEDLGRLRVALKMGVDKLERWSEFRKQTLESRAREGDANGQAVGNTLDEMAAVMEQHPEYFHPEMPETFRFLAEAARDPRGATKTVIYGAVKSAENLVSFLGQRALGIGTAGAEAVEKHISKAVATSLIAGLSAAALQLSGALPQGWAWLKPLFSALGVTP